MVPLIQENDPGSWKGVPAFGLVKYGSSGKTHLGCLVNISRKGLVLKARDLPNPDETVTLSFQLLPFRHVYRFKAAVAWIGPSTRPDMPRSMAFRFIKGGSEDEKLIAQFVEKPGPVE